MGMDIYGRAPTHEDGKYFRANIWSWAPILKLITRANREHKLGLVLRGWDCNDGDGCKNADESDKLATALEECLSSMSPATDVIMAAPEEANRTARMFGAMIGAPPSSYQADKDHVREFIRFLRSCGGFEIN